MVKYPYKLIDLNIYYVFQSIATIVIIKTQNITSNVTKETKETNRSLLLLAPVPSLCP